MGIIFRIFSKSCEEKSKLSEPVREPRKVRGGTIKAAEHGLGAGFSIGREPRVRPLKRGESSVSSDSKWGPAKADSLCGEEEMPGRRSFLPAGKEAVRPVR